VGRVASRRSDFRITKGSEGNKSRLGPGLHDGLHHLLHDGRLGELATHETKFVRQRTITSQASLYKTFLQHPSRVALSFFDISPGFLAKRAAKEMSKRPEMRRYGVAFAPRARRYSEGISRAAARQRF